MQQLTISQETFISMLPKLVASGVTFESTETKDGDIHIKFTGGY